MMNVELRHLRSFVTVAEELNFTRAAERLFIAQQALSAQIKQLEDRVGARLLERDTRHVELTDAGRVLYQRALPLLEGADAAIEATRTAGTSTKPLVVGFVVALELGYYSEAIREFEDRHPEVRLSFRFGDATDPTGGLRSGDADVALVYGPFDRSGLLTSYLFTEPLGAVMAASHPLASKPELSLNDILGEPTFDFPTADRAWRDYWMAIDHRGGRHPEIVAEFRTLDGLIGALKAGLGVHTGTRSLAELSGPDVVWRELGDLAPLEHFVAWRRGESRSQVKDFVGVVGEAFERV